MYILPVEYYYKTAISQQLLTMDVVHSACLGCIFQNNGRRKVHLLHPVRIVVLIIENAPSQTVAVSIIDIAKMVVGLQNLIYFRIDFFVSIVSRFKDWPELSRKCYQTLRGDSQKSFAPASSSQRKRWFGKDNFNENEHENNVSDWKDIMTHGKVTKGS